MNRLKLNTSNMLMALIIFTITSCNMLYSSDISVVPSSNLVEKFETLYINIDLTQPFTNPYDPEDIQVDAIIKAPNGKILVLPCFYKSGPSDKSRWEARFTAMQPGTHSYHIRAISRRDTSNSKTYQVEVKESNKDGFLRLNPNSKYSFLFDSGRRFRGVGLNLGWELQSEWRHPYETYFDELEKNNANFIRTWMCTWNLPLEWTRVLNYETFVDELENWDKTFSRSPGLILNSGKTRFTEDDTNRVTIQSNSSETIIYNLNNIKRFKIKLFYQKQLATDRIKCYSSKDNKTYSPIDIEFSQTWNTYEDWHRIFIAYITDLPDGINYLKIEFLDNLEGSPHIANVMIEHGEPKDILDAPGLGRYYQKTANRLDEIFRLAEKQGIYIMLTHDYHGVFKSYIDRWASNAEWRTNPYNAANGGPCQTPEDFFTNAEAKKIYKNKLRYLVARWGYCTHLACWEFWNEIDNVMEWQNVSPAAITNWHQEMADYLKQIDPYKHLVSTSVTYREIPGLWDIEHLDFTQHHNYGPTANMKESILKYTERFNKPDVVGEFALGWKGPGKDHPVELYEGELHNGIWRGMFSPTPILPLSWWWEWHYYKKHYYHFKMAADFVSIMLKNKGDVLQDLPVNSVDAHIETMGLKSGDHLFIWLRNSNKEELTDLTLNIPRMANTKYFVKYYNTWKGIFSNDTEIASITDQLILNDIHLKSEHDMAVWLRPVQQYYNVKSPDGKIIVNFYMSDNNSLVYRIQYKDCVVMKDSRLGLIREDEDFSKNLRVASVSAVQVIKDDYKMLHGKKRSFSYRANRKIFHLVNENDKKLDIIFQISNDGVAFRYFFPDELSDVKKIKREVTSFKFLPGTRAWVQPMAEAKSGWCQVNPSYEEHYIQNIEFDKVPDNKPGWVFPALFNYGNCWMLISETAPDRNYCSSRLQFQPSDTSFSIGFPQAKEIFTGGPLNPESKLPWYTPWRIVAIGDLKTIVESILGTDLAKPSVIENTDFIEPGRASWSWVLLKDDLIVYDVQKKFIDYAADMGWEYCLIDVNWDTKIGYDKISELAQYARSKNVGLILWYNSSGDWNTTIYHPKSKLLTHEDRIKEFTRLKEMGIKGVKVDFFGGDGQSMMAYYQDIFEDAAKYGLLVNCHGSTIPRGWQRTYPNLVSMEAVRGFEFVTFEQFNADLQPTHCCILPFTRNVFDPMDFTPVCFSEVPNIKRKTSNAFELALSIIFNSGIQHYAEIPEGMAAVPEFVKGILRDVPVSWEETRFIDGFPGRFVVMARKSKDAWYVAGINGEEAEKSINLKLPFLHNAKSGLLITDGKDNRSFSQQKITFSSAEPFEIKLKGNGGFVIKFVQND